MFRNVALTPIPCETSVSFLVQHARPSTLRNDLDQQLICGSARVVWPWSASASKKWGGREFCSPSKHLTGVIHGGASFQRVPTLLERPRLLHLYQAAKPFGRMRTTMNFVGKAPTEREAGFAAASLAQGQGNESLLKPRNLKPASCAFRRVGGQPQRAEVDQQRQAALTSIFFAGSVPPRSNGRDVARNRHQSRGRECRFLSSGYPNGRQTSSTSVGSSPAFYVAGNLVTFESLSFCSPQVTMAGVDAGRRTG